MSIKDPTNSAKSSRTTKVKTSKTSTKSVDSKSTQTRTASKKTKKATTKPKKDMTTSQSKTSQAQDPLHTAKIKVTSTPPPSTAYEMPHSDTTESESSRKSSSFKDLLGSVMPESVKRVISSGVEGWNDETLKEKLASEVVRKALEKSGEVVDHTEGSLRKLIQHAPQELIDRVLVKLDDYKEEGSELVRNELRRFLDRIDIQKEVRNILTQFSIEITTQIRFVAHQDDGLGIKPSIETKTKVKRQTHDEDS
jgi:hypothetical protein